MFRFNKFSSLVVVGSVVAALAVLTPGSVMAKGPGNSPSSKSIQVSKQLGNSPISKNLGKYPLNNKLGKLPVGKGLGKMPISKNVGNKPISKLNGKFTLCNPLDPFFCHHNFCCHPHWHWTLPWLVVEEVVEVDAQPLYTLYYETADGINVYGKYEMPRDNELLYDTEKAFDANSTAWWLVSTGGQLIDTNTAEPAVAVAQ